MGERPEENEPNSKIDSIASLVREIWVKEYIEYVHRTRGTRIKYSSSAKWDGGTDAVGYNHKPVWPKIAEFILKNKLDPINYVKAQFYKQTGDPPYPNILLSDTGLKRYSVYKTSTDGDYESAYKIQKNAAKLAFHSKLDSFEDWSIPEIHRWILLDRSIAITALFRYCRAKRLSTIYEGKWSKIFNDVADYWKDAAFKQYNMAAQKYEQIWLDMLTSNVLAELKSGETVA